MLFELLSIWALIEIFNYIYYYFVYIFVSRKKYYYKKNNDESTWVQEYLIDKIPSEELDDMLRKTFSYKGTVNKNISLNDLGYDNVLKWCAYMLYAKSMWQLSSDQLDQSNKSVKVIENRLNIKFRPNKNKNVYMLRFGNNDIRTKWKPAIYYGAMSIVKYGVYSMLRMEGFKNFRSKKSGVLYFYRVDPSIKSHTLFIHGFGFGIMPYKNFINALSKKRNIIFPILPNISNMEYHSYFDPLTYNTLFPEYDIWRSDFDMLVNKFKIKELNIVAHSFGTIISSLAIKHDKINHIINKVVLIEPVCFIEGSYKIYRYINEPYDGKSIIVSKIMDYMLYQDIYTRYVTQRFMYGPEFWIKNVNKLKEFNHYVIVTGCDQIVPSNKLKKIFKKENINYSYIKDTHHADLFLSNKHTNNLNKILIFLDDK